VCWRRARTDNNKNEQHATTTCNLIATLRSGYDLETPFVPCLHFVVEKPIALTDLGGRLRLRNFPRLRIASDWPYLAIELRKLLHSWQLREGSIQVFPIQQVAWAEDIPPIKNSHVQSRGSYASGGRFRPNPNLQLNVNYDPRDQS
jgi:hypothetical protein